MITVNNINGPLRNRVSELRDNITAFPSEVSFNKYYATSWYVVSKVCNRKAPPIQGEAM
ncbi:hypothetical protein PIL02S_02296 [Paenibacillus illinoisensis]|uniref:Uncharacterized protein n=1 Tax=Paenibacillus illinoisensis TaxID=59845 RepID=A0A2W0CAZ4_9BACL|nr:hypothetical protein PIL02S_02296 [Paenibacillus illinoisensis]